MSKSPLDAQRSLSSDRSHAIKLLKEALEIVERLGEPHIVARLQHVIDTLMYAQDP
jgi:hypothetical protein